MASIKSWVFNASPPRPPATSRLPWHLGPFLAAEPDVHFYTLAAKPPSGSKPALRVNGTPSGGEQNDTGKRRVFDHLSLSREEADAASVPTARSFTERTRTVQEAQEPHPTEQVIEVGEDDDGAPVLRQYLGYDPGFPVVQVDHYNGRDPCFYNPPSWAPALIWEFLDNLPDVH